MAAPTEIHRRMVGIIRATIIARVAPETVEGEINNRKTSRRNPPLEAQNRLEV
tara:strand:- start:722 stop:880 length:159 start_codon:yes stop_codon:yes gene_type:complete